MRVVRNVGYLKRRQRASRLMIAVGLTGLFGSIALTFFQQVLYIYLAYAALITGFLFFNAGMQQWAKWNRRPRPDELLDSTLRRLNDRYTLVHYPEIPEGWRPEHVLVWPGGILNITTRELAGRIVVRGTRWRRLDRFFLRLLTFGGPPLGNPTVECQRQMEALRTFLQRRDLPGAELVDGLIVFLNDQVQLEVVETPITVVTRKELLDAIRAYGTERRLSQGEIDEIVSALAQGEQVEGPRSLPTREPVKTK
ncbi:MAG: NERD domain-containing protein [Thermomicrobium sp.]|nr:NERD domain-containing protein [Thermomicrobium sp.]MDW8058857.1 NERD domain-containing protein [Thermomicrobium sp.]